jgi:mannose/fructose/N-acetylgalactosamine-specific phosphotransferase system component IIB
VLVQFGNGAFPAILWADCWSVCLGVVAEVLTELHRSKYRRRLMLVKAETRVVVGIFLLSLLCDIIKSKSYSSQTIVIFLPNLHSTLTGIHINPYLIIEQLYTVLYCQTLA